MALVLLRWFLYSSVWLLLLCGSPALAEDPRPALFPQDQRLDRKITLQKWRVYLGEFLELLSARSGVPLKVDTAKAPVDGIELSVCLRDQPVREVMGALVGLLEQKANRWEWQANQEGTRYTLRYQRSPAETVAAARKAVAEEWARDVREFYATARLVEPARAERAALRPDLFPQGMLASGRPDLLAALSPEQLEAVLRGTRVTFDPNRLPPTQRRALSLGISGELAGGGKQAAFLVRWDEDRPGPILWLENGNGTSASVVGGVRWDRNWMRRELAGWITQYSDGVYEFHQQRQKQPLDPDLGRPLTGDALTVFEWLKQLSEIQPLNFLADPVIPSGGGTFGGAWIGRTVEQSMQALVFSTGLVEKRHGSIHLLRHRSAGVNPRSGLVSWSFIRKLRETAKRHDGYLDPATLAELSRLREPQLHSLAGEFPSADYTLLRPFRGVCRFLDALTPETRARLTRPEGLPFRDAGMVARAALAEDPDPRSQQELELLTARGNDASVALRLETRERRSARLPPDAPPQRVPLVIWEVRVPGEQPLRRGFALSRRTPLRPE